MEKLVAESDGPVARDSISQHGVVIFACRDEIVLIILKNRREAQMCYWTRVPMAGQRNRFGGFYNISACEQACKYSRCPGPYQ